MDIKVRTEPTDASFAFIAHVIESVHPMLSMGGFWN